MATYTTNYNLVKPEGTDAYNHLIYDNPNMDTIDATLKAIDDLTVGRATCVKTGTNHAVTRQNTDASVFRFTATGDFDAGDTMTVDGVSVSVFLPNGEATSNKAYVINTEVLAAIQGTRVTLYTNTINQIAGSRVTYDNTITGLTAASVQDAIDEIATQSSTSVTPGSSKVNIDRPTIYRIGKLVIVNISMTANGTFSYYEEIASGFPKPVAEVYVRGTGGVTEGHRLLTNGKFVISSNITLNNLFETFSFCYITND